MKLIKKYIYRLLNKDYEYILNKLRKGGALIGKVIISGDIIIDRNWPFLLYIGDYVHLTNGVTILNHDFSWSVIKRKDGIVLGGVRPVHIGDNVFIGNNATILMGTHIGDNSIVGAGSVVRGCFPSGCVIAGNPAKVICSLEEYKNKRIASQIQEASEIAKIYIKRYDKIPPENIFGAYSWLWTNRTEYPPIHLLEKMKLRDNFEKTMLNFKISQPVFYSFDAFIKSVI